jgi:hypothetical protein
VGLLAEHEVAQQLPLPSMPQTPDWHCAFAVQGTPSAKPLVPPVVPAELPPVVVPVVPLVLAPVVVVPVPPRSTGEPLQAVVATSEMRKVFLSKAILRRPRIGNALNAPLR